MMGTAMPVFSHHLMCFILKCYNPMHVRHCCCRAVTEGATVSVLAGWLELRMSGESCGEKNIVSSYGWGRSCLCVGDCNSSMRTFPVSGQKLSPCSAWTGDSKDFASPLYTCSLAKRDNEKSCSHSYSSFGGMLSSHGGSAGIKPLQ